jgi:hypothetical protein
MATKMNRAALSRENENRKRQLARELEKDLEKTFPSVDVIPRRHSRPLDPCKFGV